LQWDKIGPKKCPADTLAYPSDDVTPINDLNRVKIFTNSTRVALRNDVVMIRITFLSNDMTRVTINNSRLETKIFCKISKHFIDKHS